MNNSLQNRIETSSDAQSSALKNRIIDDVWEIEITKTNKTYKLDFTNRFGEIDTETKLMCKHYVESVCDRNADELSVSNHAALRLTALSTLIIHQKKYFPNIRIKDLSFEEVCRCFTFNHSGEIASFATIEIAQSLWQQLFYLGIVSAQPISKDFYSYAEKIAEEEGISKKEFHHKGSFGTVPMPIVIPLLHYCIDVLESDRTKYLLGYYSYLRNLDQSELKFSNLYKYNGKYGKHYFPSNFLKTKTGFDMAQAVLDQYPDFNSFDQLTHQEWIFTTGHGAEKTSVQAHTKRVLVASLISWLILTGIRISELQSIKSDGLEEKNGRYTFTSDIFKTNSAVPTVRYIAGYSAKIYQILDKLGVNSISQRDSLFSYAALSTGGNATVFSIANANNNVVSSNLNNFYEEFLEESDESVRELCPRITAHMFRHSFAEFALRRFDGDIPELIRRHFRHNYGSFMTHEYLKGKEHEAEFSVLADNYLIELIERQIDGASELLGSMGKTIKKMIDDINVVDPKTAAQEIKDKLGNVKLKPHEYGFCVLREQTADQAACYDKQMKMPNTEDATVYQCSRCVHRLTLDSQIEDVKRIGFTMQERAKLFKSIEDSEVAAGMYHQEAVAARALLEGLNDD